MTGQSIRQPVGQRVRESCEIFARQYWQSFSFVGLTLATLFFSASVTPSLLPRHFVFQGLLSGFSIALGYGFGVLLVLVYRYLDFRMPSERIQWIARRVTSVIVGIAYVAFLWRMTSWQNSIRELMEMPLLESAYPLRTALIAVAFAAVLIGVGRFFIRTCWFLSRKLERFMPRKVAVAVGVILALTFAFVVTNDLVLKRLLFAADTFFLNLDEIIDDELPQPSGLGFTGSEESLVSWSSVGRQGKVFVTTGPSQSEIANLMEREAQQPIRVYVGMRSRDTPQDRAKLALEELKRVGGFDRSLLVVATPTGTGWLDPSAVDTIEFMHGGDTAIVSTQYSYLPSWITILVEPRRSIESAQALFDEIYGYWTTLPKDSRPRLYLQGLSLGSLGSETTLDLFSILEDPIDGAVWSGPPFPSSHWNDFVRNRNPDSPVWLPEFRDGRLLRFTGQESNLKPDRPWGPIRNVYIQYASDPMVWFSPDLAWSRPAWLDHERGPDVSPELRWYPLVTFLQVAFDLPMATAVPIGYGHNYAPANYIDAWESVTNWSAQDSERLKDFFAERVAPKP